MKAHCTAIFFATLGVATLLGGEALAAGKAGSSCTNKNQIGDVQYDAGAGAFWVCKAEGWAQIDFSRFTGPQGPAGAIGATGPEGPVGPQGLNGDNFWTESRAGSITYGGETVVSSVTAGEANIDRVTAGTLKLGDSELECDTSQAGLMRFHAESRTFEGCNGVAWVSLSTAIVSKPPADGGPAK